MAQETICERCGMALAQNDIIYFCTPCEDIEQAEAVKRNLGITIPLPDYSDSNDVQRFYDAINTHHN